VRGIKNLVNDNLEQQAATYFQELFINNAKSRVANQHNK